MNTSDIDTQVARALDAIASVQSLRSVYLVACGGSYALMMPNKYLLDQESTTLFADALNSAEFVQRSPAALGNTSLVIVSSMSGNTPETVQAAEYARSKGALTVGLTTDPESPLGKAVDYCIEYELNPSTANDLSAASVMYRLLFGLLKQKEGNTKLEVVTSAMQGIGGLVDKTVAKHRNAISSFAQSYKREPVIYTMASGLNYGPAYSFAICILMEMQWIHSQAIHAGEYFHGPFEITDFDTPIITLLGLDNTRPQEERALAFAQKFSQRNIVLDAKTFDWTGVAEEAREYLAPVVFGYLLRAYANALAEQKGHPLTVRRYMWKMDY